MARPKPAQETAIKKISVRWSKEDHIAFLRLGGSRWLRELVQAAKNKGMVKRDTTA